ncbi:hypothetical protein BDR07DRAFT_1382768 [Suillus spraguei]|nr:hypothetical protein BDR07DRAFT_1382768 [Suillus spraguei]
MARYSSGVAADDHDKGVAGDMPCCCPEFSDGKVWSKSENHHLTDLLLTLIEESNTYRKAFGFALLGSGKVASTGDQPTNLYRQSATALFLDHEDSPWKDVDLSDLAETVKNHVTNGLCKAFIKHFNVTDWSGLD